MNLEELKIRGDLAQLEIDCERLDATEDNGAERLRAEKEYLEEQREKLLSR